MESRVVASPCTRRRDRAGERRHQGKAILLVFVQEMDPYLSPEIYAKLTVTNSTQKNLAFVPASRTERLSLKDAMKCLRNSSPVTELPDIAFGDRGDLGTVVNKLYYCKLKVPQSCSADYS